MGSAANADAIRIGVVHAVNGNAQYRAIAPLRALERLGHEVVWQIGKEPPDRKRLATCDVVHVYRRYDNDTARTMSKLADRGVAITWDNDDDFATQPEESPHYVKNGGAAGQQRMFRRTATVAQIAHRVSTPSEPLAEKYREAGVSDVNVLPNHLIPGTCKPARGRRGQVVIGWVAAREHRADAARIGIRSALEQVMAAHPNVAVECVGVDLDLSERYTHRDLMPFPRFLKLMGTFDIGIAPLSDIPFNRARSDIKLKEYAASGIPWLASPVGPYAGLGESEGGWLVTDDRWAEALDQLVSSGRLRRRLARRGKAWAKTQTVDAAAPLWERHFKHAIRAVRR
jgi:hypothetical protein